MHESYRTVAARIGISGERDDAAPYTCGTLENLLPPVEIDRNAQALLSNYRRKKASLNKEGLFLGRTSLALLTQDYDGRKATTYRDMDYYANPGDSAYRPALTIDRLRLRPEFHYIGDLMVESFLETPDGTEVSSLRMSTRERVRFTCKKLILASGVLSTARIVLRSLARDHHRPLRCTPYSYLVCLQPSLLGQDAAGPACSLSQVSMFYDSKQVSQASVHSYRSLLLHRLIERIPLNLKDGRILMQYLAPAMAIVGIHHPEAVCDVYLERDAQSPTGDRLRIDSVAHDPTALERQFSRAFRALGCYTLGRMRPKMGSSIHYAGTLPFSGERAPLTLSPDGRLHGTRSVYVADGSGLRFLPAKGPTFTLMANAHRVAQKVLAHD
jgi:hypothetical protein